MISAPVHVQDFPARYSPQMGFEGANVIFDTWVHPLMMGLEEHLLTMFRDDFEFSRRSATLASGRRARPAGHARVAAPAKAKGTRHDHIIDLGRGRREGTCKKIPFFVRGKARNNTERFARERGICSASPSGHFTMQKPISDAETAPPPPFRPGRIASSS